MKNSKQRPIKKNSYVFSILSDKHMVFWSNGSIQHYLGAPTKLINSVGIVSSGASGVITKPDADIKNIFGRYGIIALAFSRRTSDFYQYINADTFTDVALVESGTISFNYGSTKLKVNSGEALIVPKGHSGSFNVISKNVSMWWFDLSAGCEIDRRLGKSVSKRRFSHFAEMLSILRLCRGEAYKECDIQILESYAAAFYWLIMREVRSKNLLPEAERLESIVNSIKVHPSKTINSSKAARCLGMTQYRLNRLSSEIYGRNFAKVISDIRLSKAMELVKKGAYKYSKIAKMVGYSSPFSFSHAFKMRYGKRPSAFI